MITCFLFFFFFFKQKTAYEMRISDWSSDVCSSDLIDVTKLEAMREDINANRGGRPKLTMLPLLIIAVCKAVAQFPMMNARYDDEAGLVIRSGAVHLGIATQTNAGLMVPLLRDATRKTVRKGKGGYVRVSCGG